jgi:hypothetical protein
MLLVVRWSSRWSSIGTKLVIAVFKATDAQVRGILYFLLGAAFFSDNDSTIKWLSGGYPLHEVVFS